MASDNRDGRLMKTNEEMNEDSSFKGRDKIDATVLLSEINTLTNPMRIKKKVEL